MNKKDTYLIVIAVIICIAIAVLSPYIASGNPDGLEKSAEDSGVREDFSVNDANGIPDAIFPDYALANDPDNQVMQVAVLIIGILITLALGFGVAKVVQKRN